RICSLSIAPLLHPRRARPPTTVPFPSTTLFRSEFVKLDIADRDAMAELFASRRFDRVVHLAAQAGVRYSLEAPFAYTDSNVTGTDRKSTRLNSSHVKISYAVFCLKKKNC